MISASILVVVLSSNPVAHFPLETSSQLVEMQQRQQTAMTPQRARRECWQSLGFPPNTPRDRYPARLLPQVERCISKS